jgi:mRNA interferase MazF
MPSTTGYNTGDVPLVRFPFTDFSAAKKRPALVVSNNAYHAFRGDSVLMLITSRMHDEPYGCAIASWREAGLLKPSFVKPVIMTVEISVVERKLGVLPPDEISAVKAQLFPFIFGKG